MREIHTTYMKAVWYPFRRLWGGEWGEMRPKSSEQWFANRYNPTETQNRNQFFCNLKSMRLKKMFSSNQVKRFDVLQNTASQREVQWHVLRNQPYYFNKHCKSSPWTNRLVLILISSLGKHQNQHASSWSPAPRTYSEPKSMSSDQKNAPITIREDAQSIL